MPVSSYIRNRFVSYPSALLLLLILVSTACVLHRVPLGSESEPVGLGKTKESRSPGPTITPDRSPRSGQYSRGLKSPHITGNKKSVVTLPPEPKLSGQTDGVQSELKGSLREVILKGYALKGEIEREYRLYRGRKFFEITSQDLTRTWRLKASAWAGDAEGILEKIDFVTKEQFRAYHRAPMPREEGDETWGTIDNWLNDKLDFLGRFDEGLGTK